MKYMKNLSEYLTERLLINKNFKDTNVNDEFYNKFGSILSSVSDIGWFKIDDIKYVISMKVSIEDKKAVNKIKEFFNIDGIKYTMHITEDFKKECTLYYNILKFISDNKDDIEFFYINEQTKYGEYLIYLFKADKIKVAVWGNEKIVDKNRGTISFQYIKNS